MILIYLSFRLFEKEKLFADIKIIAFASFLLPLCKKESTSNEYVLPQSKYQMLNFWRVTHSYCFLLFTYQWNKKDVDNLYLLCTSARLLEVSVLTFAQNGFVDRLKCGLLLREIETFYFHTRQLTIISLIMKSGDERGSFELFTKFEKMLHDMGQLSPHPIWEMKPFFKVNMEQYSSE